MKLFSILSLKDPLGLSWTLQDSDLDGLMISYSCCQLHLTSALSVAKVTNYKVWKRESSGHKVSEAHLVFVQRGVYADAVRLNELALLVSDR